MIKGREGKRGGIASSAYSADLLVCFPSRTHLTLTPKPLISSPSRPSNPNNHRHNLHHHRHGHHRRQLSKLSSVSSPVLWTKQASNNKHMSNEEITEPSSPKVTCAGQIKVRSSKGKNWQSVMEQIERIHTNRSESSKLFGFKKDVIGFLTCLRNIRFDFRCFGDFRPTDVTSDDEDDEEEEEEEEEEDDHNSLNNEDQEENSKTVFSKWFMVLQDDHQAKNDKKTSEEFKVSNFDDGEVVVPPANALLLMRCRSAPAKGWLEERMKARTEDSKKEEEEEEEEVFEKKKKKDLRSLMEEEKMNLVVMRYDTEYYRLSSDIAKETWVVGGINQDSLSRSRSWKS